MKVVDVVQARADLEKLLADVEAGEDVLIERNGTTVARLSGYINREPGVLRQYPEWQNFEYDPSVFAPLMTDDDLRAEGYDV